MGKTCNGICGVEITCPDGCGVLCTDDCECTQWCEPAQVEVPDEASGVALPVGVLTYVSKRDGTVRVHVGTADGAESRHYPPDTRFELRFDGISPDGLARLLSSMSPNRIQAPSSNAAERISGSASGTIAELAEQFSLVVE